MKENIGVKAVSWAFALGGAFGTALGTGLFLFYILVVSLGLDKPHFAFDSAPTLIPIGPDAMLYTILVSIVIVLFSVPAILISNGLRKLHRRAYEAALAISAIFIFSALIVFLEGFFGIIAVITISIIGLLSLVADIVLFANRQLFTDH